MAALSLAFDILARDKASREIRNIGDAADDTGRKMSKFGGVAKAGMLAGAAGVGALAVGLGGLVKEAAESAKIGRLTEAVVKSTGGTAKISAAQVADLAGAISNKTAVDDEAIQSGANLLLTFTKVRNEVGAGNDIFNQAATAAVDMSVALGTDVTSASLQLGKALNDPIKGVTALSKAGVSFTQQQKDQIKAMVEAGDVLGAQKIILGEMAVQFGGAAEAAADPISRLKTVLGNLGEEIGGELLPTVERFAGFASDTLIPAIKQVVGILFQGDFKGGPFAEDSGVVDGLFKLRDAAVAVFTYMRDEGLPALRQLGTFVAEDVLPRLRDFGGYLKDTVFPILKDIAGDALKGLQDGLRVVKDVFQENRPEMEKFGSALLQIADFIVTKVVPALGPTLETIFRNLGGFIALTIEGIGFLVGAFQKGIVTTLDFGIKSLNVFENITGALGKLPIPFNDTFRKASESVGGTIGELKILKTAAEVAAQPKQLVVSAETGGALTNIRSLEATANAARGTIVINANLRPAEEALARFQQAVSTGIGVNVAAAGLLSGGNIPGRALGGPMLAGHPYWVGENGRELVVSPTDALVISAAQSARLSQQTTQQRTTSIDRSTTVGVIYASDWQNAEAQLERKARIGALSGG